MRRFEAVVIASAVAVGALLVILAPALGRDVGQWKKTDPSIRLWFESLRQPDNPMAPCCGEADAYWADAVEVDGDKVYAIITDDRPDAPLGRQHVPPGTRVEVPPHKLKWDRGNPTGHTIIFLGADLRVWCYVQGTGI